MSEELVFKTDSTTVSNLENLSREHSLVGEQRLLELYDIAESALDLAESVSDVGLSVFELLGTVSEGLDFGGYPVSDTVRPEDVAPLSVALGALGNMDKYFFCDLFVKGAKKRGLTLGESDFLPVGVGEESFTYVRNSLSDEAYDVFSQDLTSPRVIGYARSLRECVDAVIRGECRFCLLPFEERGGVRLPTVSELIYRNDLKVNAVTPVFGYDGNADLKYALVSGSFTEQRADATDDRYLEIRLDAGENSSLTDVLSAAAYFDMSVFGVNTATNNTEGESSSYFSVVLREGRAGFTGLLTYLTLFVPEYTTVGVYKNLE